MPNTMRGGQAKDKTLSSTSPKCGGKAVRKTAPIARVRTMSRSAVHRAGSWAAICLTVVTAMGCAGGDQEASPTTDLTTTARATTVPGAPNEPAATSEIVIEGFRYSGPISVAPGAQITVLNKDSAEHTVTSDTVGEFDSEVMGNASSTFTAPNQPGTYAFHCTYHPSMVGTLVVR
jgi:plastocyanin